MASCPKCGSIDIRESHVSETLEFAGKLVTKLPAIAVSLPLGAIHPGIADHINRSIAYGMGKAGGKIAKSAYNKFVCKKCGCVFDNPQSIWED